MLPAPLVVPRRGRPAKFGRPAQPVTITLPDDTVAALRALDPDLSRAIVRLAETSATSMAPRPPVELTHYGRSAVIVVTPTGALGKMPGVALVPLPDGRALISLAASLGIAEFEVMVRDALDTGTINASGRVVLEALDDILRTARRSRQITMNQRNIIVLESHKGRNGSNASARASRGGSRT